MFDNALGAFTRLAAVDWDFPAATTSYLTHRLHPYPAKFIPQIPQTFIQELSTTGDTVADIFCGSGTTLVESLLLGRHAIGFDANPVACLISKAKTTRLSPDDGTYLQAIVTQAYEFADRAKPFLSSAYRPDSQAVTFWFEPWVIEELAEIVSWCRAMPTDASRTVALAVFSSIVVAVSKQDSDTRYVRRQKNLVPGDAFRRFGRSLSEAIRSVSEFTRCANPQSSCQIRHVNLLTRPDTDPIDLVVCSPPYPNAYSYHLYHMTRMVWLDMDQPRFKREEIGSHRKYSNKGPHGASAATFRGEMAQILDWLCLHLRQEGYACFVVGDSTIRGQRVSNVDLLAEVACEQGFREVWRTSRRLQDTRKAFNPSIGKIKTEYILVLQKQETVLE